MKTSTGAAATYQRTAIELESLARVVREVEVLVSSDQNDNEQRINALRSVAMATLYPLRAFSEELKKYEAALFPATNRKASRARRVGRALQWTLEMDEEVQKLQLYINGQLLSISTLFQLLER